MCLQRLRQSCHSFLATHNWWHLALDHLDLDQIDAVLVLLDGPICGTASGVVLDMVDASSLLWRLHLRGIDVGDRWQALADRWAPLATAANYAFNDMHAMMAFAAGAPPCTPLWRQPCTARCDRANPDRSGPACRLEPAVQRADARTCQCEGCGAACAT